MNPNPLPRWQGMALARAKRRASGNNPLKVGFTMPEGINPKKISPSLCYVREEIETHILFPPLENTVMFYTNNASMIRKILKRTDVTDPKFGTAVGKDGQKWIVNVSCRFPAKCISLRSPLKKKEERP